MAPRFSGSFLFLPRPSQVLFSSRPIFHLLLMYPLRKRATVHFLFELRLKTASSFGKQCTKTTTLPPHFLSLSSPKSCCSLALHLNLGIYRSLEKALGCVARSALPCLRAPSQYIVVTISSHVLPSHPQNHKIYTKTDLSCLVSPTFSTVPSV